MQMDNKGEGGTLSLMALAQRALGKRTPLLFLIGIAGASMFYGDAMITPAMSVLSAVEGLKAVPSLRAGGIDPFVLPIAIAILVGSVRGAVARHRRGRRYLRPDHGGLVHHPWARWALLHLLRDPSVLRSAVAELRDQLRGRPRLPDLHRAGLGFPGRHRRGGALRRHGPFRPPPDPACLGGAGAAGAGAELSRPGRVRHQPTRHHQCRIRPGARRRRLAGLDHVAFDYSPFFEMAPDIVRLPLVILATTATVIASQAVISGAFSLTQQAIQLGLLPRMEIRRTSETQAGQIYMPQINWLLLAGVLVADAGVRLLDAAGGRLWHLHHRRDADEHLHDVHRHLEIVEAAGLAVAR